MTRSNKMATRVVQTAVLGVEVWQVRRGDQVLCQRLSKAAAITWVLSQKKI